MIKETKVTTKQNDRLLAGLTWLADGTAVIVAVIWLADLAAWFGSRNVINVVALTLVYLVYCLAVYLIRKLEPQIASTAAPFQMPGWLLARKVMAALAVLFGLMLAVLMLDQLGYWESIFVVDDRVLGAGESAAFFVYAPGAFIAIAFFYILVLSGQTRETILLNQRRYVPLALLGLLGANGMLLLLTAVFQSMNLSGVLILPLLLLLFGPPRLWYLSKRPSWGPLVTFILLLLFLAFI